MNALFLLLYIKCFAIYKSFCHYAYSAENPAALFTGQAYAEAENSRPLHLCCKYKFYNSRGKAKGVFPSRPARYGGY